MKKDINSCYNDLLNDIKMFLESNFYNDKGNINKVQKHIEDWYDNYQKTNSLKSIEPELLKQIDLDITDMFDIYITSEPVKENYVERMLYDFGHLKKYWEKELTNDKYI